MYEIRNYNRILFLRFVPPTPGKKIHVIAISFNMALWVYYTDTHYKSAPEGVDKCYVTDRYTIFRFDIFVRN
jgi:hypothetical protein